MKTVFLPLQLIEVLKLMITLNTVNYTGNGPFYTLWGVMKIDLFLEFSMIVSFKKMS